MVLRLLARAAIEHRLAQLRQAYTLQQGTKADSSLYSLAARFSRAFDTDHQVRNR